MAFSKIDYRSYNVGKVEIMTAKENVLNNYPLARSCYVTSENKPTYSVIAPEKTGSLIWDMYLGCAYSEEAVWESAWEYIQIRMLQKLES